MLIDQELKKWVHMFGKFKKVVEFFFEVIFYSCCHKSCAQWLLMVFQLMNYDILDFYSSKFCLFWNDHQEFSWGYMGTYLL